MVSAIHDLRYGARLLRRAPLFTFLAVTSLVIGLSSSVALFTVMNAALFRSLPGVETGDVYKLYTSDSSGDTYGASSFADYQSIASRAPELFAASGVSTNARANVSADGNVRSLPGALVSGGYFELLKLSPHRGRLLNRSDDAVSGGSPAVVISYPIWLTLFGGDPNAAGREVTINGVSAVVVGVAPRGFAGLSLDGGADFWAAPPLASAVLPTDTLTNRGARKFHVFARLNDGVSASQAESRLAAIAEQLRVEDPRAWTDARNATRKITVLPEIEARFAGNPAAGQEIATGMLGAVAVILLVACVNLATMMMARGAARTRELNVRLAIGASRGRILRQLLTESLLLAIPSAVLSVIMVAIALRLFDTYRPSEIPSFSVAIDASVVGFTVLIALMAVLLFGLAPGAHAVRLTIADGIKGRPAVIRRRWLRAGARELLIVTQVTVSFALLIVASLFTRSLIGAAPEVPGLQTRNIAVISIELGTAAQSRAASRALVERLLRAAAGVPGVDRATAAAVIPVTGSSIGFAGRAVEQPETQTMSFYGNVVAPGYFEVAGIPLRAGRGFDERDHGRAPAVAIVSESLARRLWNAPPIGRTIRVDDDTTVEVIGVAGDVPYRTLEDTARPLIYLPIAQTDQTRFLIHARIASDADVLATLDRALRAVDARIVVGAPMSMSAYLDQARAPARAAQWIGGAAGLLQLGLALMAIWGLVAYAAERRTAEIGVRLALGASRRAIAHLIMRPSVLLVAAGTVLGCIIGAGAAITLHAEFTNLAPIDLTAALPAAVVFSLVAAAAAWLPARRATAIDPASALRQQ